MTTETTITVINCVVYSLVHRVEHGSVPSIIEQFKVIGEETRGGILSDTRDPVFSGGIKLPRVILAQLFYEKDTQGQSTISDCVAMESSIFAVV